MASAVASRKKKVVSTPAKRDEGYWEVSRRPLIALLFILPILILHEWGVHRFADVPGGVLEHRITAFSLIARFFAWCGAYGRFLPAMAVVSVLLSWHIARRDPWTLDVPTVVRMYPEAVGWALPLVGVYLLGSPAGWSFSGQGDWRVMGSLYLGAGVYEELVFRLGAFSVLSFLVLDVARVPRRWGVAVVIVTAAALFAIYHQLGNDRMAWQSLVFIGLRGVYYGIIFVERGFGITVGAHTAYDLMFLGMREVGARG